MQLHADSFEIQAANLFNGNEVGILFSTFNCTSQAVRQQLASGILHHTISIQPKSTYCKK